ncbi:MAG: ATP-binding protein [Lachnospiraceae bacterium]|nr:ATP-binding protein [Lachnospiraceae bacterium]
MRSYRLYENMDPEADISGEDFDLVSQLNENMKLDRIFEVVKEYIIQKGVGNCRSIVFIQDYEEELCMRNYYDMMIIMKNLLINAIQAGAAEIKVETVVKEGELVITVSDDGKGIDPQDKPYIFTPRFSTKEMKPDKDAGLGLYNVRKAIINSKGKFEIDSTPGKGTTCVVRFPLKEVLA